MPRDYPSGRRAFIVNLGYRDYPSIRNIADELVPLTSGRNFDLSDPEKLRRQVTARLGNFSADHDILVLDGHPVLIAFAVNCALDLSNDEGPLTVAYEDPLFDDWRIVQLR